MRVVSGVVLAAALCAGTARAGDGDAKPADWRAQAKAEGLSDDDVARLASTKLLVAGCEYRQVFEPYINSNVPTFVTADSVLNAYHVLFEESVVRLERAQAARLPSVLRPMWDGIPDAAKRLDLPSESIDDAVLRARVLVGTALRLLGEPTPGAPDDVAKKIDAEAARVLRAEGRLRPEWLGAPDAGFPFLDYGRFAPRGFYVRDERLKAYFRAVSWLQAVPLRVHQEREVLTALLLAESMQRDGDSRATAAYGAFVGVWATALGTRGDISLPTSVSRPQRPWTKSDVDDFASACARRWFDGVPEPRVAAPTVADAAGPLVDPLHGREPGLRVIPAVDLPDGELFDRCCAPSAKPAYPTGLLVAAALGGAFARGEALRGRDAATTARIGDAFDAMSQAFRAADAPDTDPFVEQFTGARHDDLYAAYLRCISALLDPPEPDAPPLFASAAWQAKSTNAALAGWAQLRHTWVLQARESADYGSAEDVAAGFVEPDPEFFTRLADLSASSAEFFETSGGFDTSLDRRELLWSLADYAAHLRGPDGLMATNDLPRNVAHAALQASYVVHHLGGSNPFSPGAARKEATIAGELAILDDAIARLGGDAPLPPKLAECVAWNVPPFRATWRYLERTCRRLESMAQKQLRGLPWSETDAAYLHDFGHVLARAMFYGGNAYASPRDDAPRATSVYAWLGNPEAPAYFQAAIARPRSLFVLYPWKGGDVLCRGAVMPYREFVRDKRLTDDEWRALLDSKDAPPAPEWMAPITAPVPPAKPR